MNGLLQVLAYTTQDVNRSLRLNSQPVSPAQEQALFKLVEKSAEHSAGEHTLRAAALRASKGFVQPYGSSAALRLLDSL